jgi:hypothetical protein
MKRSHQLIIASGVALLLSYLAWEWYLSPRARVERFLGRMAEATEEKDVDTLMAAISREYSDFRGMDYETLAGLIERGFADVDRVNVTLEGVRAQVEGASARASFDLMVVAVKGDERYLLVGRPMAPEKIRVDLLLESGGWKILKVEKTDEFD